MNENSDEVAKAFRKIYKRSPLKWPQILQVDPGREFTGAVTKEMENHKTYIRRGHPEIHRDQALVERFNGTLAESLFGHQYAVETLLPEGQRSVAWLKRLPAVVAALNNEATRLTGRKAAEAIKDSFRRQLIRDLWGRPKKSFQPGSMFAICFNQVSWKAVCKEPQIQFGLLKFSHLKEP